MAECWQCGDEVLAGEVRRLEVPTGAVGGLDRYELVPFCRQCARHALRPRPTGRAWPWILLFAGMLLAATLVVLAMLSAC